MPIRKVNSDKSIANDSSSIKEQGQAEDEEKMALLRSLAAEGFNALDQGRGTVIDDDRQLRRFIGQIGRRGAWKD